MTSARVYGVKTDGGLMHEFWCPGCHDVHSIRIGHTPHPCWHWNGSLDEPSYTPSIRVTGVQPATKDELSRITAGETIEPRPMCCHSFVTDGQINFLSDCTHALSGTAMRLPLWDREQWALSL
jgi:hypothetical protein